MKENDNCECGGGIETVGHYLLQCPKYENEREIMRRNIFDCCGIANFGLNMLLDAKKEEDFKEWRNTILSHLENYVFETRRFANVKLIVPRTTIYREFIVFIRDNT